MKKESERLRTTVQGKEHDQMSDWCCVLYPLRLRGRITRRLQNVAQHLWRLLVRVPHCSILLPRGGAFHMCPVALHDEANLPAVVLHFGGANASQTMVQRSDVFYFMLELISPFKGSGS